MTPDVIRELQRDGEPSKFHQALLAHAKRLIKTSRASMSENYSDWDLQDEVYRGIRHLDNDDLRQRQQEKPVKMIVPNTFAQVMTFTSFLFLMFNQNRKFFELNPTGEEDFGTKNLDCEAVLERDLAYNQKNQFLFQHLLDVARFGPSITECCWTRKLTRAYIQPAATIANVAGVEVPVRPGSQWQEFVKYEGNLIRNVSPFRFFPDLRGRSLTDFQKGEFCAAEEEYSMAALHDLEASGEVAGVDHIRPFPNDFAKERGGATRSPIIADERWRKFDASNDTHNAVVTKMQIWIVPSKFKFGEKDEPLGPETFPVLYHLWYANDNRIIRVEPAYWWHNEFGWTVAQFTPDMHETVNLGLADLIYRLQDVISWFVNSHITSVRRVIQNRNVVNASAIDTKSLDGEGDIFLRKGVNMPLDRAIMQQKVQDVTSNHMNDVQLLGQMMQIVTGVNDNAMGQYNSGRRSAQEARVVTAGAAGRMKMHGHLIWESSLGRLGRLMLSNARQSLSFESFSRIVGTNPMISPEERYATFKGTPEEVICGNDFMVFDSTLASEKGFIAQSLQELLVAVMSNPAAAQGFDIDPRAVLEEIQHLRGAGPISRFSLSKRVASGQAVPPPPAPLPAV